MSIPMDTMDPWGRCSSSNEDTPPPSMSDAARRMQEKQKRRNVYQLTLTQEELVDSSTFRRFLSSIDDILENLEGVDLTAGADGDDISGELLLGRERLSALAGEAAEVKAMGVCSKIPADKLVKLLNVLDKNIQDGAALSTAECDEEEGPRKDSAIMERVVGSADACLAALSIMTSMHMPKAVYIEDVIERVLRYTKFHLANTLYPQYDPVYKDDPHGGGVPSSRVRRARRAALRAQPAIVELYDKVCDIVANFTELLGIQLLTDTTLLQVSSVGITPFFVENVSELQLCAIGLVTALFSRYDKHRQLILEDIFASLARLPTSKRSLRSYRLNGSDRDGEPVHVQMVTALVLQLIQCVVRSPCDSDEDQDALITGSYETATWVAHNFLSVFLKKYGSKQGEEDYRPLFENFLQDLLSVVNRPEMPAAELLLGLLGRVLVQQFTNKQTELALRVASLDYLGTVAAHLRRDAVANKIDRRSIERILEDRPGDDELQKLQKALLDYLKENAETDVSLASAARFYFVQWFRDATTKAEKSTRGSSDQEDEGSSDGVQHSMDAEITEDDQAMDTEETEENQNTHAMDTEASGENDHGMDTEATRENDHAMDTDATRENDHVMDTEATGGEEHHPMNTEVVMQNPEKHKIFLRNIMKTMLAQLAAQEMMTTAVKYEDCCLIVRYLASVRPFAKSFDIYLAQILRVLGENAIAVRTKAVKCLSEIVAVDPGILARADMQSGVESRLIDNSTSVREAAVDLLGRFVLSRPQLTEQYYPMLVERILDTGVSVRKRVIKILTDICLEQPAFSKVTEICVKMIHRVNDEQGIQKLVNDTFQKLWFTPTPAADKETMIRKIHNITGVVAACRETGCDWFEQLIQNLLKSEDDSSSPPANKACVQLVDSLVEDILKHQESLSGNKGVNSTRLVACITTLCLFSKVRARLMVKHATTLQPYLRTRGNTANDVMVICNVAKTLELVVPLMKRPSRPFLAAVEEDLMKLIIQGGMAVVQHCVSCLGAIVNRVTRNYKFVLACFNKFYAALNKLKQQHQEEPDSSELVASKSFLLRSLFTVGALGQHFDFDHEEFKGPDKATFVIKDKVLELLLYFTEHEDEDVKIKAVVGLGFLVIMHPGQMSVPEVKALYNGVLADGGTSVNLKIQILRNLEAYLQAEDVKMKDVDREWKKLAKKENLKEMRDVSSGMSSSIVQLYQEQVLEAFFHTDPGVRSGALGVVALTLNQGLIQPLQFVPYLIAAATDPEPGIRTKADLQLEEIDKKYKGFVLIKAVDGMRMSFRTQLANAIVAPSHDTIIRGFRQNENHAMALCSHLFSLVGRVRQHRRDFLRSLLRVFEDGQAAMSLLLFIADHLAYFPYQSEEEPLFIVHHIDNLLSVSGSNLLQTFFREFLRTGPGRTKKAEKEQRLGFGVEEAETNHEEANAADVPPPFKKAKKCSPETLEDAESDSELEGLDAGDVDKVMSRLPESPAALGDFACSMQGVLLLSVLKQHLKNLYGLSDGKIQRYSPTESAQAHDKPASRKSHVHFDPRQTLDFMADDAARGAVLTDDVKRRIVEQFLELKVLMERLDPADEEEDKQGDTSAGTDVGHKPVRVGSPRPTTGPGPAGDQMMITSMGLRGTVGPYKEGKPTRSSRRPRRPGKSSSSSLQGPLSAQPKRRARKQAVMSMPVV